MSNSFSSFCTIRAPTVCRPSATASFCLPRNTFSRSLSTVILSTPSLKDSDRSLVKSLGSMNDTHRAGCPSLPARPACWMYASGDLGRL